jgi:hypothetical protein
LSLFGIGGAMDLVAIVYAVGGFLICALLGIISYFLAKIIDKANANNDQLIEITAKQGHIQKQQEHLHDCMHNLAKRFDSVEQLKSDVTLLKYKVFGAKPNGRMPSVDMDEGD